MVISLFDRERITTTKAKAMEVRRTAEKLITRAKEDSVHNRRIAARKIHDDEVLAKLFKEIGPRMKDRNGGYTRVLKLGFRRGDAAELVLLELVDYVEDDKKAKKDKAKGEKKAREKAKDEGAENKAAKPKAEKPGSSEKPKAPRATKKAAQPKADAGEDK
jgi:large subunit ribosomal protein L17